jgi:hypothetical protein
MTLKHRHVKRVSGPKESWRRSFVVARRKSRTTQRKKGKEERRIVVLASA